MLIILVVVVVAAMADNGTMMVILINPVAPVRSLFKFIYVQFGYFRWVILLPISSRCRATPISSLRCFNRGNCDDYMMKEIINWNYKVSHREQDNNKNPNGQERIYHLNNLFWEFSSFHSRCPWYRVIFYDIIIFGRENMKKINKRKTPFL